MKKVTALILAAVICLSLCACGKSEAVKNTESLIAAIGEVTLDSESAIVAAEEAYAALTTEEKEQVENYSLLTDVRAVFDPMMAEEQEKQEYYGEWQFLSVYPCDSIILSNENYDKEWTLTHGKVNIQGYEYTKEDCGDFIRLVRETAQATLVRAEDATVTEIEITMDNWQDYFTLEERIGNICTDPFGDITGFILRLSPVFKEDIQFRLVDTGDETYKIAMEVSGETGTKLAEFNPETSELTINEEWEYRSTEIGHCMGSLSQSEIHDAYYDPWYLEYSGDIYDIYMNSFIMLGIYSKITRDPSSPFALREYIPDPQIVRLEGTLLLYDKPLMQP